MLPNRVFASVYATDFLYVASSTIPRNASGTASACASTWRRLRFESHNSAAHRAKISTQTTVATQFMPPYYRQFAQRKGARGKATHEATGRGAQLRATTPQKIKQTG